MTKADTSLVTASRFRMDPLPLIGRVCAQCSVCVCIHMPVWFTQWKQEWVPAGYVRNRDERGYIYRRQIIAFKSVLSGRYRDTKLRNLVPSIALQRTAQPGRVLIFTHKNSSWGSLIKNSTSLITRQLIEVIAEKTKYVFISRHQNAGKARANRFLEFEKVKYFSTKITNQNFIHKIIMNGLNWRGCLLPLCSVLLLFMSAI
jgi:hypothetical protein